MRKIFSNTNLFTKKKIVLYILLLVILFSFFNKYLESNHIAVVDINHSISLSNNKLNLLNNIRKNDKVKAVILRINSPGGSIYGGEMYFRIVKRLVKEKMVVSFVNGSATSAAYLLALPSNYIIAYDNALIGSVGVFLPVFNFSDILKKIGIKTEFIKSSPSKGQPNMVEPTVESAKENMESVVDDIKEYFFDKVFFYRKIDEKYINNIKNADVFVGYKAKDMNLIDANGDLIDSKNYINNKLNQKLKLKFYNLKKDKSFFNIFSYYLKKIFSYIIQPLV